MSDVTKRLRAEVVDPLRGRFVGRDEVVDLIALAVVAGEHLFLYGPPGTAKSALVRGFASGVRGRYFEYLLTRFSEPNEVFGPIDLARLREGTVATVTTGMLPEAEFAFLDELFNANSAILNNLLTVLNERVYRRGAETHQLPLISLFSASNHLPDDDALQALFDRFLLRCKVEALPRDALSELLAAGWALEREVTTAAASNAPTADELRTLARRCLTVDLERIREPYADAVMKIRDLGVGLTDRRMIKALKLVAASAVLCDREVAELSDLWVLRHLWDREEQIGPLTSLVAGLLEKAPTTKAHPRAATPDQVDGEDLMKQLDELERAVNGSASLMELARLRERLAGVADRAAWVTEAAHRRKLLERTGALQERLG